MLGGMIPACFVPSRQFTPHPWRGRPPRLPRRVRFLLDALVLAAIGLTLPLALLFVFFGT
jgi:hypothetical protein